MSRIDAIYGGHIHLGARNTDASYDELVRGAHVVFVQGTATPKTAQPWRGAMTPTVEADKGELVLWQGPIAMHRLSLAACVYVTAAAGTNIYLVLREEGGLWCHRLVLRSLGDVRLLLRPIHTCLAQLPDEDSEDEESDAAHAAKLAAAKLAAGGKKASHRLSWSQSLVRHLRPQHARRRNRARRESSPPDMAVVEIPTADDAGDALAYGDDQPLYDVRTMAGLAPGDSLASLDSGFDSDIEADDDYAGGSLSPTLLPPLSVSASAAAQVGGTLSGLQPRLHPGMDSAGAATASTTGSSGGGALADAELDDNAFAAESANALADLRARGYYHGHAGWAEAAERLGGKHIGAFLVRAADALEEEFVVSVISQRGVLSHLNVLFFSGRYHVTGCTRDRFVSVAELVDHHMAVGTLLSGCRLVDPVPLAAA